ncbi:MAG: 4-phytase, partial [Armatimonadetes bacterium]|nr:4-phytase [Armatimonadota bacterium]
MRSPGNDEENHWSRRRLLLAAAAAPGLWLLAGCGGGGDSAPSSNASSTPKGGSAGDSKLTLAIPDDISSLDPAKAFDTWSTAVVHAVTRRLVDYDQDGKLIPDLAEKWDRAADGKSYTFHLKPDIKYADGAAIEAGHFKAALERVLDPKTASSGASFYAGIGAMEAPDARTFIVRLKAPDPTLLNLMGMTFAAPVAPKGDPSKPAPSGPYTLEDYAPGNRVVLKRNAADERTAGWVEQIEVQLSVTQPLQLTRFRSGDVDLLPGIPPAEYSRVMRDPQEKDNVVQGVVNQTWYFGMNVTRAP